MNITTSIQTITPERAAEMLKRNTHNRAQSRNTVEMYAREMTAGAWKLTGESIKIATDGTILDGQHRLMACVRSGASFRTMVVTGIGHDAQFNMDQGQRRRAGQQLDLKGYSNSNTKAAAARILIAWEGGSALGARSPGRISVTETLGVIGRWPTIDEAAKLAKRIHNQNRGLIPTSVLCAFLTLALTTNHHRAREFATLMETGAGLSVGHPILILRNQCASYAAQQKKLTHQDRMAWLVIAWTAFLDGKNRKGQFKRNRYVTDFPGLSINTNLRTEPAEPEAPKMHSDRYVTVKEASEATGRSRGTINRWIRYGLVDARKKNPGTTRSWHYVNLDDVERVNSETYRRG